MEVRIGVTQAHRDVVLESNETHDAIMKKVEAAIKGAALLSLTDDKGRTILVAGDRIAFVEVGAPVMGRVGFATV